MFQPAVSVSQSETPFARDLAQRPGIRGDRLPSAHSGLLEGVWRRCRRELRRRKIGRAYDMALEIARFVPARSRILDIGCGNGFIAHHLSSLVGASAIGIDLGATTEAAIDYRQFDGCRVPVED